MADKHKQSRANWQPDNSRKIVGRYVIEGDLILDTPTHFGNGETNGTEMMILEVAGEPLLPGASIAGALRHYLQRVDKGYRVAEAKIEKEKDLDNMSIAQELFGIAYKNELGEQSRVIVDDAIGTKAHLISRDGVRINGKTGIAEDGQLFSIQLWNRGATFPIRVELLVYEDDTDTDRLLSGLVTALAGFDKREIPMGARKTRGYGECHVKEWCFRHYDFKKVDDVLAWVREGGQSLKQPKLKHATSLSEICDVQLITDSRQYVRIDATFNLADTLLIRSLSDVADTAHLVYEDGTPVLSGTSVAGALRARALKIAQTFAPARQSAPTPVDETRAEMLIHDMFGRQGTQDDMDEVVSEDRRHLFGASRLLVKERAIIDPDGKTMRQVQNRIKIDRFTGGEFKPALFAQQPVFALDDTRVEISLELQYPAEDSNDFLLAETGLLLLLLKDLWTGDLPLGGERSIGRGRLTGECAEITIKNTKSDSGEPLILEEPFDKHTQDQLEEYVSDFITWVGG